jgi:hypothetical protein
MLRGNKLNTAAGRYINSYWRSPSPGNIRAFCKVCGSNMPVLEEEDTHVIIPAGGLDDDPIVRPARHFHTASKAPWFEITDAVPQFAEYPPEEFRVELESAWNKAAR